MSIMSITGKTEEAESLTGNSEGYNEVIKKLKEYSSMCSDVVFSLLFGSFARRNTTFANDLDIAIFFQNSADFYRLNNIKEELSEIFNIAVDIVMLNNASPVIKMQVLKNGILLISKDPKVYNDFFVETINEYDDLKQTRREIEEKILKGRIYA